MFLYAFIAHYYEGHEEIEILPKQYLWSMLAFKINSE